MNRITVAAAALNQTPLAWEENARNIRLAIALAKEQRVHLLCLPELCLTGYGCEDLFHAEEFVKEALDYLQLLARDTKGIVVNIGLPLIVEGVTYNTAALLAEGKICGFVAKQNLAGEGIHYEPRWFKPWPRGVVSSVRVGARDIPVGDIFFDLGYARVGFEICEDAWVADRPAIFLAQHGVDLILNPSASHFAFSKQDVRRRFILEASRACGVGYVYANLLGCEAGRSIYDGDTIIASHGEIVSQGPRFSFKEVSIATGTIDLNRCRLIRRKLSSFSPRFDGGERVVPVRCKPIPLAKKTHNIKTSGWEDSPFKKHEEFTRAVALGLFDYMRKSRSHGFVISFSGGVDSSACGCLVALMFQAAIDELGLQEFKKRLGYIPAAKDIKSHKDATSKLLSCVYQATRNSSKATHRAAQQLSKQLAATFFDIAIDSLVEGYSQLIEKTLNLKLSWEKHNIALQNIQARVRSPSVWLIANLKQALLLTTSNRSEASVGYTTMDGDSSGGLAPLGGIDKAYLREWLQWLERHRPQGLSSFSTLSLVNAQAPTAELKPLKQKQTDEGELMPYVVLDSIERKAIRDKLLPLSVYEVVCEEHSHQYSKKQLALWVERFFTLWSVNQWKRERYAPSFHLDDENVDPKTWCRFPILSGGFQRELAELRKKQK